MSKRTELWVSTGTQSEYNVSVGYKEEDILIKEEDILIREEPKEVFFTMMFCLICTVDGNFLNTTFTNLEGRHRGYDWLTLK